MMMRRALVERVCRFLLGGVLGYVINLCVIRFLTVGFGSLVPGLGMVFAKASAISIGALLVWGFFYSYYFNFRTERAAVSALAPYFAAMGVSALSNYVTVNVLQWLFPQALNVNVACGMVVSGAVKFLLYHFVVFPLPGGAAVDTDSEEHVPQEGDDEGR
jgi:putative flippase GtrA